MKKLSRISFAAMSCCVLGLATGFAHAQSQPPSGGLDTSLSTQPSASTSASGASYTPLPTEPTGAGYAGQSRYSWIPYTTAGYIGLSVGNGSLDTRCIPGTSCDDPRGAVNLYTGGMFTPYFGVQLGYFRLGDADRNGGKTKVSGANISLVGLVPLAPNFSLVGRAGGTYGWTEVSAGVGGVTLATGKEEAFVPAYGAGISWDFHPNWSATLDWDRHHLKYAGDDRKNTDIATVGLKYRF